MDLKKMTLEFRGKKTISFPVKIKEMLKPQFNECPYIEFKWKGDKFVIVNFEHFCILLNYWKNTPEKWKR